MMREALVDRSAISRNVETLRAAAGDVPAMVIVKANGYGHGAVPAARAALDGGAEWLGTADLDEALELRAAGIEAPVLAWLHEPDSSFVDAIDRDIDLGVSNLAQLDAIAGASGRAFVHLKVDTGLGRNGAAESDWPEFFAAAAAHEAAGRIVVRGVWSHLANAGTAHDATQLATFHRALDSARAAGLEPPLIHLAATEAAIGLPEARFSLVRFGVGAYGLAASDAMDVTALGLTPAMQLSAAIAGVKRVPAGTGVSYGLDYHTTSETSLALVPLGYADGIPRHASGRGPVSINGVTYRIAGHAAVVPGDRAIIFGDPATGVPAADDWAKAADTILYEIVTRIGSRVQRRYVP
jgi:alanine racemase